MRGCVILNSGRLAVMKNPRPLLYTNMTPTKTPIPSKPLNLAFKPLADLLGWGSGWKTLTSLPRDLRKIRGHFCIPI